MQIYTESLSEPRIPDLEKINAAEIRKMTDEAIANPSKRESVLERLEKISANRSSKEGGLAIKAIATILTVQMLEILKK
ncbi:MAG: hypothetical protein QXR85_03405 [Candidatus Micrarchaeaceae archaeon]